VKKPHKYWPAGWKKLKLSHEKEVK